MAHAWELWVQSFPQLLAATIKTTIPLALISFALALVLGTLVALARFARVPVLSQLSGLYVWVFRGTPLLVQLFIVFFGLPKIGVVLDAWTAAIVTLSLNTGAYASEAIRASIVSVPHGQWEAGYTLNLTQVQVFGKVIAPQAFRIALPPLSNDFIDLIKGTSLVSTITITDLFMTGQQIASATYEPLILYVEVAAIYLLICTLLSFVQSKLEAKSSLYVQR